MRLMTQEELDTHPALSAMGPEPFSPEWTPAVFGACLARRAGTAIKAALLDQRVVAGVGNIYADEALFRSGIHPRRLVGSLTPNEVACLHHAVRTVLTEATSGGGTTSDEYVDADGQAGRYTPLVYDRAGQRCRAWR
jgi:formamidopyrimidine-DNA glycosylase